MFQNIVGQQHRHTNPGKKKKLFILGFKASLPPSANPFSLKPINYKSNMFPPDARGQQGYHQHPSHQHNQQQRLAQGTTPQARWSHHHSLYKQQPQHFGHPGPSTPHHHSSLSNQQQKLGQGTRPPMDKEESYSSNLFTSSSSGMRASRPRNLNRRPPYEHTKDITPFPSRTFRSLKTPCRYTTVVPSEEGSNKGFNVYSHRTSKGAIHLVRTKACWGMSLKKMEEIKREREQQQLSQGNDLPGSISTMTPVIGDETRDASYEQEIEILNMLGLPRSELEAQEAKYGYRFWASLDLYGTNCGPDSDSDFMSIAPPDLSM